MKHIYIIYCLLALSLGISAQVDDMYISLPEDFQTDAVSYTARKSIHFSNETSAAYQPGANTNYAFTIEPTLLVDYHYDNTEIDFETRTASLSESNYGIGNTSVQFDVLSSGAAGFSYPIAVPKGIQDMEPGVSINYSSQSGNGLFGYGASLGGLSAISRVGQSRYYDGNSKHISFDNTDNFTLNGERLILQDDGTYLSNNEDGSIIEAFDTDGDGNADYFTVKSRNGNTYYYGNCFGSNAYMHIENTNAIMYYYIARIEDNYENYIEYIYKQDKNETWLSEINYTGNENAGIEPVASVKFSYMVNDFPTFYHVNNTRLNQKKLIDNIYTYSHGKKLFTYEIEYQNVFRKNVLKKLQVYNNRGESLSPVYFETAKNENKTVSLQGNYPKDLHAGKTGDINGDGFDDIVTINRIYYNSSEEGKWFSYSNYVGWNEAYMDYALVDYNNDGFTDIVTVDTEFDYEYDEYYVVMRVYFSNENGNSFDDFIEAEEGVYNDFPEEITLDELYLVEDYKIHVGDYNLDGLQDFFIEVIFEKDVNDLDICNDDCGALDLPYEIMCFGIEPDDEKEIDFTTDYLDEASVEETIDPYYKDLHIADFNGDGKPDFLYTTNEHTEIPYGYNTHYELYLNNSSGSRAYSFEHINGDNPITGFLYGRLPIDNIAHINTDKKADIIVGDVFFTFNGTCFQKKSLNYKYKTAADFVPAAPTAPNFCDYYYKIIPDCENCYPNITYPAKIVPNHVNKPNQPYAGFSSTLSHYLRDINDDGIIDVVNYATYKGNSYIIPSGVCYDHGATYDIHHRNNEGAVLNTITVVQQEAGCHEDKMDKFTGEFTEAKCKESNFNFPIKHGGQTVTFNTTKFINVYESKGNGHINRTGTAEELTRAQNDPIVTGDFNGDGVGDKLYASKVELVHNLNLKARIAKVSDGYGNTSEVSYTTLKGRQHVLHNDKTAGKSFAKYLPPTLVANQLSSENGSCQCNNTDYSYSDAVLHKTLGFMGFSSFTATNAIKNKKSISKRELLLANAPANGSKSYTPAVMYTSSSQLSDITEENIYTKDSNNVEVVFDKTRTTVFQKGAQSYNYVNNSYTKSFNEITEFGYPTKLTAEVYNIDNLLIPLSKSVQEFNYTTPGELHYKLVESTISTQKALAGSSEQDISYTTHNEYYPTGAIHKVISNKNTEFEITKTYVVNTTTGIVTSEKVEDAEEQLLGSMVYEYTSDFRFIEKETDIQDFTLQRNFDLVTGQLKSTTDAYGLVTSYTYDSWNRTKTVKTQFGTTTYDQGWATGDDAGKIPGAFTFAKLTDAYGNEAFTYYDVLGRNVGTKGTNANGVLTYSYVSYNNKGELETQSEAFVEGETPNLVHYTYDELGRVTNTFDDNGLLSTTTVYSGLATTITNNLSSVSTTQTSNVLGQLISSTDKGGTITYSYNILGLNDTTKYNGQTLVNTYDFLGRRTAFNDPNAGLTTYEYDHMGNLTLQTDAEGNQIDMVYDTLQRLESLTYNNEETINYAYVEEGIGKGLLQSIANTTAGISETYTYNKLGQLENTVEKIDGVEYEYAYTYNTYGALATTTYPFNGLVTEHIYNTQGMLTGIASPTLNGKIIWQAQQWNNKGSITNLAFNNNAFSTTLSYDAADLLDGITTVQNANNTEVQNLSYVWNHDQLSLQSRSNNSINGGSITESFEYDDLNRLTDMKAQQSGINIYTDQLEFHDNGSIKSRASVGTYKYDNGINKALTGAVANYYENNILSNHQLTYTAFNKVAEVNTDKYRYEITYGPKQMRKITELFEENRLIKRKVYAGGLYEEETDVNNELRQLYYIPGPSGEAAVFEKKNGQEKLYYILKDNLGSYQSIANENGNILEQLDYDAWGLRRNPETFATVTGTNYFDRGYTGHEHIAELGLINMNGRMYDPHIGQMISPDNYVSFPTSTQGYNRYAYVMNNPFLFTDPTGQWPDWNKIKKPFQQLGDWIKHDVWQPAGDWISDTWTQGKRYLENEVFCETCEFEVGYKTDMDGNGGWFFRVKKDDVEIGIGHDKNGWGPVTRGADGFTNIHNQNSNKSIIRTEQNINRAKRYEQVSPTTMIETRPGSNKGIYKMILPRDFGEWGQPGSDGYIWKGCMSCHAPNGAYRYAAYNSTERWGGVVISSFVSMGISYGYSGVISATKTVTSYPKGSFSVSNWTGYPQGGIKPSGPFRLLEGVEYTSARSLANSTNAAMRRANPSLYKGLQIHEIHPVKFGGSPTSLSNKIFLTPAQHAPYTKFWNNMMRNINKIP